MNSLRAYYLGVIRADETMQGYLGGTGRVYPGWRQDTPEITAAKPAYIAMTFIAQAGRSGEQGNAEQEGDVLVSFDIKARLETLAWIIKARIHTLIGNKSRNSATAKTVLSATEDSVNNLGVDPTRRVHHLNVTYRLAGVWA